MERLTFVGLGAMGHPMARRLAAADDLALTLFDSREEAMAALADRGRPASSLQDAVEDADLIFSVLPTDQEVVSVADEVTEYGKPGQLYVDFSTIAPGTMDAINARLDTAGITAVSATCMKGVSAAQTGELSLFLGGTCDAVERLRPLLGHIAAEQRFVGSVAAAKTLKILNNLITSSLDLILCEALLVAARLGSSPDRTVAALLSSGADSWALRNHIMKHALTGDVGPGRFSVAYMGKDVDLAAGLARSRGRSSFFAGVVLASYRGTTAHGRGADYHPVVLRWLELAAASPSIAAMTESDGSAELRRVLTGGVVALQALTTFEALHLGCMQSLSASIGAGHLLTGSARNPSLQAYVDAGRAESEPALADLSTDLELACELAQRAEVPAMSFEVGRNLALAYTDRWGPAETLSGVLTRASDQASPGRRGGEEER